jgi:hypothetical protein
MNYPLMKLTVGPPGQATQCRAVLVSQVTDERKGRTSCGAHTPSCLTVTGLSHPVERPEREAHHSPPSSAEVKNGWRCTSAVAVCLRMVDKANLTCNFIIN